MRDLFRSSRAYGDLARYCGRLADWPASAGVPLLVGWALCFWFALVGVAFCFGLALVVAVFCFGLGLVVAPKSARVRFVIHVCALAFGAPRVVALQRQYSVDVPVLLGTTQSRAARPEHTSAGGLPQLPL